MSGKTFLHILLIFPFILSPGPMNTARGQEEEEEVKRIISLIADDLPEEESSKNMDFLTNLSDDLKFYKIHKININKTTPEVLKDIPFLSAAQVANLFRYLRKNGKLIDLMELQSVPGFDTSTIEKLLPFLSLEQETEYSRLKFSDLLKKGNHELFSRYAQVLEQQKGYTDLPGSRYLGSPQKLLFKYRYRLGNTINASLLFKKDAGETFFSGNNRTGFDFVSGSLLLKNAGPFSRLVIGDYSLQFGQGISLWSGFSLGKGADVAGLAKKQSGLGSYTSGSEHSFFRGLSVNFKPLKIINLTPFISLRNLDANLTQNQDQEWVSTGLSSSGLHRTASEIAGKGSQRLLFYGLVAEHHSRAFSAGIILNHSQYKHPFSTGNPLYKKHQFSGTSLSIAGFHYNYSYRNSYLFGECSKSLPGGMAFLNGIMASLSPGVSAVVLYRNYAKDYHNFYAQALAEGEINNERGIYAGINIRPASKWLCSAYLNTFQLPWLRYRIDFSSSGSELMTQLTYTPSKSFKAQLKLKTKQTAQNTDEYLPFNSAEQVKKDNCRIGITWKLNREISLEHRAELTRYQKSPSPAETGYLVYQDISYTPPSSRISGNLRIAGFHTSSYNSRLYAYEDDVLYASSSGLYYGKGMRTYLNLKLRITRKLHGWLKYALSVYGGQERIGSGLDEIQGHQKSELKAQLRYQF